MTVDVGAQLRRGVVEYCVLGLLSTEPMYGWQLSAALTERSIIASIGTLYPLLSRLRDRGLVLAYQQESTSGPTRKYYRITPAGEQQLREFRDYWLPFAHTVTEIVESE